MVKVLLLIFLNDFPFPMYGQLATFGDLDACQRHIDKEAPPELRPRLVCLRVLPPADKEA